MLPDSVKTRLTIENDDKLNMFSVKDLLAVQSETGIPIVFDYLHHQFCTGGWNEERAFMEALNTWPSDITPIVHFSSSKKIFEDQNAIDAAHADYIYQQVNLYGKDVDVMLEAKAKEQAVLKYVSDYKVSLA
jgi:UV DNA damage endonuclease